jgi:hypothetical protein
MYLRRGIVILSVCLSVILSFILSVPRGIIFINVPRHIPRTVHKCGRLALCYALRQLLHLPGVVRT